MLRAKYLALAVIAASISACATSRTLEPKDGSVKVGPVGFVTYCDSLPRIYSGTAYNGCLLAGDYTGSRSFAYWFPPSMFFGDVVVSLFADTVVLPYTITRQVQAGGLRVKKVNHRSGS